MLNTSKPLIQQNTFNYSLTLKDSLLRTANCYSLEHCFLPDKNIDKAAHNQDCTLKRKLQQYAYNQTEQHLGKYYDKGIEELRELTEYYKYYTQTSINYQPLFYKMMHYHREQKKAVQYNRLKVMLELSNSTHNDSSNINKLENTPVSSFRLLSMLKFTNSNEESLLLERLKEKLQKDYGPNKFKTLQEIDKQFCFTKTIDLAPTFTRPQKQHKRTKVTTQKDQIIMKNRINFQRNHSCGLSRLNSTRKDEDKSKIRRKKNASMDNLTSITISNSKVLKPRAVEPKEFEVKKKILGVKEQIRKQKEMLVKKIESNKPKKPSTVISRKVRH